MSDNVTTAVSTRILDNAGLTTGDLEKTLGKIMRRSIDEADLYRELATLRRDVPVAAGRRRACNRR